MREYWNDGHKYMPLAPSFGKESTLGMVLPLVPEKRLSEALPHLLVADISIIEAPKEGIAPSK